MIIKYYLSLFKWWWITDLKICASLLKINPKLFEVVVKAFKSYLKISLQ